MPLTHFDFGIATPLVVGPSQMPVVPTNGNVFFLDGNNGSDGYDGRTPDRAFKTLDGAGVVGAGAYAACVGNANEIIYILGGTTVHLAAAFVWAKNNTHLIGLAAPTGIAGRARISATAVFTPMFTVTGRGCIFSNFEIFFGQTSATGAAVCWLAQGQNNYYGNVHFAGGGDATQAADASCRSLVIDGGGAGSGNGENLFENCVIGLDTIPQVGASFLLEVKANSFAARNRFKNCFFDMTVTATAPAFVSIGASSLQRFISFENCIFHAVPSAGSATPAQAFAIDSACNGNVILHNSMVIGCTALVTGNSARLFGDTAGGATTANRGVALTG